MDKFWETVRLFVNHPAFVLLGFLISIMSLIMTFDRPRVWAEKYIKIPRIGRSTWLSILLVGIGISLALVTVQFGLVVGLIFAEAMIIFALFFVYQNGRKVQLGFEAEAISFKQEIHKLKSLLVYIYGLHKAKFRYVYWRITYTIDADGGTHTREEMAIEPINSGAIVYFRQTVLGLSTSVEADMTVQNLRVLNKQDQRLLSSVEISKNPKRYEFAVILDPPAIRGKPTEISIESFRPKVFEPLVANYSDQGELRIMGNNPEEVEAKFIAPQNLEISSFSVLPRIGSCKIEMSGNLSIATWHAVNATDGIYSYQIQVVKKK